MKKGEALRSCIACRAVRPKKELVRFVLSPEGAVVPDYYTKLPGRGCYLCPHSGCIEKGAGKGAFSRAFKAKVDAPAPEEIGGFLYDTICGKIASLLSLAIRSGMVSLGTTAVEGDLRRGSPGSLLLLSSDMSETAMETWRGSAERVGLAVRTVPATEGVVAVIGNKKVLGLKEAGMAETLIRELDRLVQLQEYGPKRGQCSLRR